MEQKDFIARLTALRINKGVSARDMSLSVGLSESYIAKLENGDGFPSMPVFFYICEYLGVTPAEFFDTSSTNPTKLTELLQASKGLTNEQLDSLITLANGLSK